MKKLSLVKNILFVLFSSLFFIFSLVLYIQSFENKMDTKSKVQFDEKYVVYIIIAICFLVLTIYNFVMEYKKMDKNPKVLYLTVTIGTLVLSLFYLSSFFSALLDYWDKDYFVFKEHQLDLYIGITVFILFLAFVFKYFDEIKKKNK